MKPEEIDKLIITLALELYHNQKGAEAFARLTDLQKTNPEQANDELNQFILANEEYLTSEIEIDLVTDALEE